MTFNSTVPLATQSPGLFPPQNKANFDRIKANVDAEHNFLDTDPGGLANPQGYHRKVSFLSISNVPLDGSGNPNTLQGSIGILFAKSGFPVAGQSQLFFYNGATTVQITPTAVTFPDPGGGVVKQFNGVPANSNTTKVLDGTVYVYDYAGSGWAYIANSTPLVGTYTSINKSGANRTHTLDTFPSSSLAPRLSFVGNNLVITNPTSSVINVRVSLQLNRTN